MIEYKLYDNYPTVATNKMVELGASNQIHSNSSIYSVVLWFLLLLEEAKQQLIKLQPCKRSKRSQVAVK